jgi:hypothetical protein
MILNAGAGRSGRHRTAAGANSELARLGVNVKLSDEALEQLVHARDAAEEFQRRYPERAALLAGDREALLRALVEEGLLTARLDALDAAAAKVRRQVAGDG